MTHLGRQPMMTVRFHRLAVGVLMCVLALTPGRKAQKQLQFMGTLGGEYIHVGWILGKAVESDNFNTFKNRVSLLVETRRSMKLV